MALEKSTENLRNYCLASFGHFWYGLGMRHETIITQRGFLDILRKFHDLSKKKDKNGIDEIIIELTDKEVLEKVDVPLFVEELAERHHVSIQDMISFILKTFVLDWKMGRTNFQKFMDNELKSLGELKNMPHNEAFEHLEKFSFKKFIEKINQYNIEGD